MSLLSVFGAAVDTCVIYETVYLAVELNGLCGLEVQIREKENEIASLKSDIKASQGNKDKLEEKFII